MASNVSNGKQPFNPDELYFNDMDIRAWERRTVDQEGLAYGDDYGYEYGYVEDEGYYEDAGNMVSPAEYEELLFQRTLDKIRFARATGEADVSLTPEELEAYQNRMWRQRAPAARAPNRIPQTAPVVHAASASSSIGAPGSSSPRSKKNQRRSSLFGSKDKSKKEKSGNRARATSNATESTVQQTPPGFLVPGPNGQPMFAPINAYQGYSGRDGRQPGSPLRPGSRPASKGNERHANSKGRKTGSPKGATQAETPPQSPLRLVTTSRDIPGAFPSSPVSYRMPTPPLNRPGSSSSRQSAQDPEDRQASSSSRSRSSTVQQPQKLVPFPIAEYKHHNAEPFQYQAAGHLAQPSAQPQYARRVASAEAPHPAMPRRVPVPGQHLTGRQGIQSSYSDPAIPQAGGMADVSEEGFHPGLHTDESGSSVQTGKSTSKQGSGSGGGGKESERRRRSGRSRRKN